MTFNFFVLPFLFGLIYMLVTIVRRFNNWIRELDKEDKVRLSTGLRSRKIFTTLNEVFFESLVHRRMFKRNKLLGYMHMTFALGWFLLIVTGYMESRIYSGFWINPPYYPIFLKFFIHDKRVLPFEIFTIPGFFRFAMDLILMFILSGLVLALIKRQRSRWFGLKKNARHQLTDKVAMTCLWLIFPLRLLAEKLHRRRVWLWRGLCDSAFRESPRNALAILRQNDRIRLLVAVLLFTGDLFCDPPLFPLHAYSDRNTADIFPELRVAAGEKVFIILRCGGLFLSRVRCMHRCLSAFIRCRKDRDTVCLFYKVGQGAAAQPGDCHELPDVRQMHGSLPGRD